MKIIITEEQYKKLIESKDYYDFWDINYVYETIQEFLHDKANGKTKKTWRLIPFEQYRNALIEFMRYGQFMRFPTKYIDQWADIVTNNTLSLAANTELAGHSQHFPFDEFCDAFGFEQGTPEYDKYYGNYEECAEYLYDIGFDDWTIAPYGTDAISDYGLEPLYKLIMELEEQTTPEQKIVVINKILDVYHQRGDLASLFIQGGTKALSQISYPEEKLTENTKQDINEMPYPESFNIDTFKSISSFAGRIKYMKEHLNKHIGKGSSRMVFRIDDEKVFKLAINNKGLAQNQAEAHMGYNENYFDCIAKVFDYDDEKYLYVEMEMARKCSPSDFKRITGYDFKTYLNFISAEQDGTLKKRFTEDFINDAYDNNSLMVQVIDFIHNWKLATGDLFVIEHYGIVNRNGEEYVVIRDYGLTEQIFQQHYTKKKRYY